MTGFRSQRMALSELEIMTPLKTIAGEIYKLKRTIQQIRARRKVLEKLRVTSDKLLDVFSWTFLDT